MHRTSSTFLARGRQPDRGLKSRSRLRGEILPYAGCLLTIGLCCHAPDHARRRSFARTLAGARIFDSSARRATRKRLAITSIDGSAACSWSCVCITGGLAAASIIWPASLIMTATKWPTCPSRSLLILACSIPVALFATAARLDYGDKPPRRWRRRRLARHAQASSFGLHAQCHHSLGFAAAVPAHPTTARR